MPKKKGIKETMADSKEMPKDMKHPKGHGKGKGKVATPNC